MAARPDIDERIRERMLDVGVDLTAEPERRAGTYVQLDDKALQAAAAVEGLEVMPIFDALEKHEWLRELYGSLVPTDKDEFTRRAEDELAGGYFIRALPGAKITAPVQACLYLFTEGYAQAVHNVIVAEEGSYLPIITGCASHYSARRGQHIGISEFFVRKNATVRFTMVHSWGPEVEVRPRTVARVEENGAFLSDYVSLDAVRLIQTYPSGRLVGRGAAARFRSVLAAPRGTVLDLGADIQFRAPDTSGEIVSRAVSSGGHIIARGRLSAFERGAVGRLECKGLLLAPDARIGAVPELDAAHPDVQLSHEAAVGRISEDEIYYLMARGLSEEQAIAAIVHGFLDVGIEGLPPLLEARISELIAMADASAIEG